MICEADTSFIQSVCTTWQSPQFCNRSTVSTSSNRLFTVMKKGGTEVVEPYVNKSPVPKLLPQLLHFDAKLVRGHTTQGIKKVLHMHAHKHTNSMFCINCCY